MDTRGAYPKTSVPPLAIGRVIAHEVRLGPGGEPETDANGNPIPTGLLRIEILDTAEVREKVPYIMPGAGNSTFIGSPPEVGAMCVIGWRSQNRPVVIGFLPPGLDNLSEGRQVAPTLEPGEVLIQGSKTDLSSDGEVRVFPGPRLWFDRLGRIILESSEYTLTAGYLLTDEYTTVPDPLTDPVTDAPVLFRERVGQVERRVDMQSSEVRQIPGDLIEHVGGDRISEIRKRFVVTASEGVQIRDQKGNGLVVGETDDTEVYGNATATLRSGGQALIKSRGDTAIVAAGGVRIGATEQLSMLAVDGIEMLAVKGSIKIQSPLTVSIGSMFGVEIASTSVALGTISALAQNPFVTGIGLNALLTQIIAILRPMNAGLLGGPNPLIASLIETLQATVTTGAHLSKTVKGAV